MKQTSELGEDGETIYKHLSKIFEIAHALPTSSAPVEQTFSCLKLIISDLRSRLNEETAQALIMINEEFRNGDFTISEEMLELFEETKNQMIAEKIQVRLKDKIAKSESLNVDIISQKDELNSQTKTKKRKEREEENISNLKHMKTNQEQYLSKDLSVLGEDDKDDEGDDDSYHELESNFSESERDEGYNEADQGQNDDDDEFEFI